MTQPPDRQPRIDLHGAVDLSGLGRTAPAGGPPPPAGGPVVDVTDEATFGAVVQQSAQVPVVLVLWAAWSEASTQVAADLVALAGELDGRLLVARLDADANPQLAQAVGAEAVPTVLGVLRGQPVPLFQGPAAREDIKALLDRLLEVAEANQITGRVPGAEDAEPEPEEPPLPPLHQEAYDAIEAGDLARAADAYRRALAANPRDDQATAGLGQVELLRRVEALDPSTVATRAADPTDLDAQLDMADLELASDRVDDAFARLLAAVRRTVGADRERVRERLVGLFAVVGDADPRVARTRRELASALY
ncbi:tetratricopeptide repeat protein [Isoptericola sp. b441]|uniref:Tetratricopeptide repeat protein n=1 Tax=Actinotalea lenta TaxID=3064654 RepID=A0ABT9DBK3_9CELL|nr:MULTISPECIES: tetratricopeptide repeat protein [unclassified Isoptericola]MDO8108254.1 tetratricopeptide repeat protein [Isoptericola sp. b441]MDO8120072.1 tetratricopeptide repeat protein [Isoptericola sp. b490]